MVTLSGGRPFLATFPKSGLDSEGDSSDQKELIGPLSFPSPSPEKWSIIFQHFKCFVGFFFSPQKWES